LGTKNISQILTLTFLAVWHGFYPGYYTVFLFEFLVITGEKLMVQAGFFVNGYWEVFEEILKFWMKSEQ